MTLRFMDSFDHYVQAEIGRKYSPVNGGYINAGQGRGGTQALRSSTGLNHVDKAFTAQATWIVGFAIKFGNFCNDSIVKFNDGASNQVELYLNSSGTISVRRNGTVILGPSTRTIITGIYNYLEFKATISDTAPAHSVQLKMNGELWLDNSGNVDTKDTANASATVIQLYGTGYDSYIDDYYICDGVDATATQGFAFNDFQGDVRIRARYVGADGNYTGSWTRNGAGVDADYKAVDETLTDSDTTYLSSSTPTQRSSWTMINLADVGTIKAIQTVVDARKDDAGARTLDTFLRKSGTDYDAADDIALPSSYVHYTHIYGEHPDGTHWTPAEVDSLEIGIEEVA